MRKRPSRQPILLPVPTPGALERKAYTIEEAAEVLGIGRNTVLRIISEKRLRTVRCGKRVIIPIQALDEFLAPPKPKDTG
jgi:excisionase family DNA binding protein